MLETHELGHIVGGYLSGGRLQSADMWPWHLPYSIFQPDPHPLITLWSGLISWALVPLLLALLIRRYWAWFIARFCLLANGLYIAAGWWSGDPFLDTTKLLEHGSHRLLIATYCALTIGFGYFVFRRSCVEMLWPVECTPKQQ